MSLIDAPGMTVHSKDAPTEPTHVTEVDTPDAFGLRVTKTATLEEEGAVVNAISLLSSLRDMRDVATRTWEVNHD